MNASSKVYKGRIFVPIYIIYGHSTYISGILIHILASLPGVNFVFSKALHGTILKIGLFWLALIKMMVVVVNDDDDDDDDDNDDDDDDDDDEDDDDNNDDDDDDDDDEMMRRTSEDDDDGDNLN